MDEFEIAPEEIEMYERQLDEMQEELDELYSMLAIMKEKEERGDLDDEYNEIIPEMERRLEIVFTSMSEEETE